MVSTSNKIKHVFRSGWAISILLPALLFCLDCRPLVPRNGWDKSWGPLVPHDKFPGDCSLCHVPDRWDVLRPDFTFDHERQTGYALQGAHAEAACLRCHNDRGPVQVYVARGCGGCHPDPHASSLGLDCERCHNQRTWDPVGLIAEHARTRFPLYGVHAVTPCESCHPAAAAGRFRGAAVACELCHQNALAEATSPDHAANGWTVDCQRCHTATAWQQAVFAHDFFPLTAGHAGLTCIQCHTSGTFGTIPSDCYSCHQTNYEAAPDHVSQSYSHSCEQCHTTTAWSPAAFDHTQFPLTGGHSGLACSQCHTGGTFTGLSSDCYSCHASDYANAPDHTTLSFSHDCTSCHTTTAWTPSTFSHDFPLTGSHDLSCTSCHNNGSTTTFSCIDCHTHNATDTASQHSDVQNYQYNSNACYSCHPNGSAGG